MNLDDLEDLVLSDARSAMSPSKHDASRVRARVVAKIGIAAMGSAAAISGTSSAATAATAVAGTTTATVVATAGTPLVSAGVVKALVVSVLAFGTTAAVCASQYVVQHRSREKPTTSAHAPVAPVRAPTSHADRPTNPVSAPIQPPMVPPPAMTSQIGAQALSALVRHPSRSSGVSPARVPAVVQSIDVDERKRLGEEVWLLKQADQALRTREPKLAMKQLDELALRAPNGTLMEEREAVRTLAQCIANSGERAKRTAQEFLEQHPTTVYATRIRVSCALSGPSSEGVPRARTLPDQEELLK